MFPPAMVPFARRHPSVVASILTLLVTASLAAPALASGGFREGVWSMAYHLRHARETGAPLAPDVTLPPAVPLHNSLADGPDIRVTPANDRHQSENSIAVSPLDNLVLLNSNNSTDWPVTTIFGTSWFLSTDGGQTWTGETDAPDGVVNNGDPAAAIDLDERFYIGYIDADGGQGVSFSTDRGTNWTEATIASLPAPDPFDLLDKNHLTVDNVPASPFNRQVYSAWTEFIDGGPNDTDIVFSFSTDGGSTWSALANISNAVAAGGHNQGVNIQTGPNGEVYCCWTIYDTPFPPGADEIAIGFNSSTDGGATFVGESRIITDIRGIRSTTLPNEGTRANSFPSMAVDVSGGPRNGWIFIVWTNIGVPGVNTGDADIYMARSTDGGTAWSTPVRVNDDATTNAHWFPWATCDPVTGDLSVIFYDRRDDAGDLLTTEYVASSTDGGSTWTNQRVGDVQFTPLAIAGLAAGYMGDYLGIAARGCQVYPCWGDYRVKPFTTYVSPFTLDNTPPSITCPDDITVECSAEGGTPATDPAIQAFLNGASATDICDATPTITHDAPALFPEGATVVTFTATDDAGNSASCMATVTVIDTTPPTIAVTLSRYELWPPNHKMVTITATVVVEDVCDANPTFVLTSITSDEPDNGLGDGDRPDDIQGEELGTPDTEFQLRSERQGIGDGREYTIVYTVTDGAGNTATDTDIVTVPHDQGGFAAGSNGFDRDGTDFNPGATTFTLVILSTPSLDASTVQGSHCLVGNHMGVIHPTEYVFVDADGDQLIDLRASYEVTVTEELRHMADDEGLYPVGFRYETADRAGYWVADIFALGPPIETPTTAVEAEAPVATRLGRPQPNPFTHATRLAYAVAGGAGGERVEIAIFNVSGQRIRTLLSGLQAPGHYQTHWDGRNDQGIAVPAGVYFYHLDVGGERHARQITLVR